MKGYVLEALGIGFRWSEGGDIVGNGKLIGIWFGVV
jgi:hypothetical protein